MELTLLFWAAWSKVQPTKLFQRGTAKYNCMGLALCTSCPAFANPIARPKIWICSCQIVMSFCCVQKKKANLLGSSSVPFTGLGLLFLGWGGGGTSMDLPPWGFQMCPAQLVGEKGLCQCLCCPQSLLYGAEWEMLRGVWLFADWRESKKFVLHREMGEQRDLHF